jgi:aryl-alcohol dehydrogenase-like predicted oxidoreductase
VLRRDGVSSAIIGVSRAGQLKDHLAATEMELPPELLEILDRAWFELPRRPPDLDSPRIPDFHGLAEG